MNNALELRLRELNEALLVSAVRQQELAEQARDAQAATRESEGRYRTILTSIDEGFCIIEMMFDERDKPVDYRFLEVNPTFEQQSGLLNAVGKTMRELRPTHEENWFQIYGKVSLTGEPVRFVSKAKHLVGTWYDVYACRVGVPESRKVAVVFNDIPTGNGNRNPCATATPASRRSLIPPRWGCTSWTGSSACGR